MRISDWSSDVCSSDLVAGALDDDAVARPHAEAPDLVAVVQGDVRHHHPADGDGGEPPDRGQLAGAADLDVDGLQRRLRAFGGEFMRDGRKRLLDRKSTRLNSSH